MCERSGRGALRYAASLFALRTCSRPYGAVDTKSRTIAGNRRLARGKGFNALELSLSQPVLIRHRQVLLPRLNHDVTSDGIQVCKGLLCGQTGLLPPNWQSIP